MGRTVLAWVIGALVLDSMCGTAVAAWSSNGPDGGAVSVLAVDPTRPGTLYAGTLGSGVFASSDGGAQWRQVNDGLPPSFSDRWIIDLKVAPSVSTTVYTVTQAGLFRTLDSGGSWNRMSSGAAGRSITIDPSDSVTLYTAAGMGGGYGAAKSTDGGASFTPMGALAAELVVQIGVDPGSASILYAATANGVFKSVDAGSSWVSMNVGLPGIVYVLALALDPSTPGVIYLATSMGVFKTIDGAATWAPLGIYSGSIAVDPMDPSVVYAVVSGGGVARSADGGASWGAVGTGLPTYASTGAPTLVVDAGGGGVVYAGTSRAGVYRTADGGATWVAAHTGFHAGAVMALALAPSSPSTVYAGTEDLGLWKTADRGRHWSRLAGVGMPEFVTVRALAVDPRDPGVVYAGCFPGSMLRTVDGGATWLDTGIGVATSIVIDQGDPDVVYVGSEISYPYAIWRSTDAGVSWSAADGGLTGDARYVEGLDIDPTNSRRLFAATYGGIYKSFDGGGHWVLSTGAGQARHDVKIDPTHPATVYASIDGRLHRTTDDGASWSELSTIGYLGDFAIAIDPGHAGRVYAGVLGLGQSDDFGATWRSVGSDSIGYHRSIVVDSTSPESVYVGAFNGVFALDLCGPNPEPTCRPAASGGADLKLVARRDRTRLAWRWGRGSTLAQTEFQDASGEHPFALCVYERRGNDTTLSLDVRTKPTACDGAPCWRTTSRGRRYRGGIDGGVGELRMSLQERLRPGSPGIRVDARGLVLPMMPLGATDGVTVQMTNGMGACWESRFGEATIDDGTRYQARSD